MEGLKVNYGCDWWECSFNLPSGKIPNDSISAGRCLQEQFEKYFVVDWFNPCPAVFHEYKFLGYGVEISCVSKAGVQNPDVAVKITGQYYRHGTDRFLKFFEWLQKGEYKVNRVDLRFDLFYPTNECGIKKVLRLTDHKHIVGGYHTGTEWGSAETVLRLYDKQKETDRDPEAKIYDEKYWTRFEVQLRGDACKSFFPDNYKGKLYDAWVKMITWIYPRITFSGRHIKLNPLYLVLSEFPKHKVTETIGFDQQGRCLCGCNSTFTIRRKENSKNVDNSLEYYHSRYWAGIRRIKDSFALGKGLIMKDLPQDVQEFLDKDIPFDK